MKYCSTCFRLIFSAILYCFFAVYAHAATLYFNPVHTDVPLKSEGKVILLLNTELESINAVEGVVTYPTDIIKVTNISIQNSIIPFWVEEPFEETAGIIRFSGIIPNGFSGLREAYATEKKSGIVLTIEYTGTAVGSDAFSVEDAKVFLNDGMATEALLSTVPGDIDVLSSGGATQPPETLTDVNPPERFSAYLVKDDAFENLKWSVVFSTTDKESGVAYYEVTEVEKGANTDGKWVRAVSPYVLKDQVRSHEVRVRAIDRAGNVREAETAVEFLPSSHTFALFEWSSAGILTIVLLVLLIAVFFILYARKRRQE